MVGAGTEVVRTASTYPLTSRAAWYQPARPTREEPESWPPVPQIKVYDCPWSWERPPTPPQASVSSGNWLGHQGQVPTDSWDVTPHPTLARHSSCQEWPKGRWFHSEVPMPLGSALLPRPTPYPGCCSPNPRGTGQYEQASCLSQRSLRQWPG